MLDSYQKLFPLSFKRIAVFRNKFVSYST